jgi:hypothetical protein
MENFAATKPYFFSSPLVRREMEHRREEPTSGWVGLRCLQSKAVGWALVISLLPPERETEEIMEKWRRKMVSIFCIVF